MPNDEFKPGDKVQVAAILPEYMSHFGHTGEYALVKYSYNQRYERALPAREYCLYFKNGGASAWWPHEVLTLIEAAPTPAAGPTLD